MNKLLYNCSKYRILLSFLINGNRRNLVRIPLVLEDANFLNSERAVPDHMTGTSQAFALSFKGRIRDSPLENPIAIGSTWKCNFAFPSAWAYTARKKLLLA